MQHNYVYMQHYYVYMQHNYVYMQHYYVSRPQGRSFLYAITQLLTHRNSSKKIEHISDSLRKKEKKWALLFQWRHNNSVIVNYDVLNFVTMLDFIFRLDIPCYLFCFVAFSRSTGFNTFYDFCTYCGNL